MRLPRNRSPGKANPIIGLSRARNSNNGIRGEDWIINRCAKLFGMQGSDSCTTESHQLRRYRVGKSTKLTGSVGLRLASKSNSHRR